MAKATNKSLKKSNKRRKTGRQLQFEQLDIRQLMAADLGLSLEDGVLAIAGGEQADFAEVAYSEDGQFVVASLNEQASQSFAAADVQSIRFQGGSGNDTFVNRTAIPSVSYGGEGTDFLLGGAANDRLDGGAGEDFLFGGPGDDELVGDLRQDQLEGGEGQNTIVATAEDLVEDGIADKVKEAVDEYENRINSELAALEAEKQAAIAAASQNAQQVLKAVEDAHGAALANTTKEFDDAVAAEQTKLDGQNAAADSQADQAIHLANEQRNAAVAKADSDQAAATRVAERAQEERRRAAEEVRIRQEQEAREARDREIREQRAEADRKIQSRYDEYRSKKSEWERWEERAEREVRRWQDRAIGALPRWARGKAHGIVNQANSKIRDINNRAKREIQSAYNYYKSKKDAYLSYRDSKIKSAEKTFSVVQSDALKARDSVYSTASSTFESAKNTALQVRADAIKFAEDAAKTAVDSALKLRDETKAAAESAFERAKSTLLAQRNEAVAKAKGDFASAKATILKQRADAISAITTRLNELQEKTANVRLVGVQTAGVDAFFADFASRMPAGWIQGVRDGCGRDTGLQDPVAIIADSIRHLHHQRLKDFGIGNDEASASGFDSQAADQRYRELKYDLFNTFRDEYGFVVHDSSLGADANYGDAQFRTGLTLVAVAIEGDMESAASLLRTLIDHGFGEDGRPRKYPGVTPNGDEHHGYTRDQFIMVLAGIHFSWKHGDENVRELSTELMGKLLNAIKIDGSLDESTHSVVNFAPLLPFLVEDIADEMGLSYDADRSKRDMTTALQRETVDWVRGLVENVIEAELNVEVQGELTGMIKLALPENVQRALVDAATSGLQTLQDLMGIPQRMENALNSFQLSGSVRSRVLNLVNERLPWLSSSTDVRAMVAALHGYNFITALTESGGDDGKVTVRRTNDITDSPYVSDRACTKEEETASTCGETDSFVSHLFFWQALLFEELHPQADSAFQLQQERLARAAARHNWVHFDLLAGHVESTERMLVHTDWESRFRTVDYMWQRPLSSQQNSAQKPERIGKLAPVDYLVLWGLHRRETIAI